MKNTLIITILFLIILFTSCESGSGNRDQRQSAVLPAGTSTGPVPIVGTPLNSRNNYPIIGSSSQLTLNPKHGEPGHRCDIAVGAPLPANAINNTTQNIVPSTIPSGNVAPANATTTVASGLNPKHGEPGHRCDIAVGAPLSTPVKANAAPAITTSNVSTNNKLQYNPLSNTAIAVAPGMNPKHGQPGHRCDIAVGAPLSDTAKSKTTSVVPTNLVETKPTNNETSAVDPLLNPKHGEPGHRCDIAVGAPLSSAPKQ
ncbi:MAG: hypothetical protein ABUT20_18655 [Bacteroidota bacterium]